MGEQANSETLGSIMYKNIWKGGRNKHEHAWIKNNYDNSDKMKETQKQGGG